MLSILPLCDRLGPADEERDKDETLGRGGFLDARSPRPSMPGGTDLVIRGRRSMLDSMARKSGVLSVVVSGAAPAADVGSLVKQALERGWTVQVVATPSALAFFDAERGIFLAKSKLKGEEAVDG